MLLLQLIFLFLLLTILYAQNEQIRTASTESENLQINTPSGKLFGSILKTRLGKTIYSFRGIRYAEPPIGDLRFKDPVPIKKWNGTYNATVHGPVCIQPSSLPTSEDCLFLNVYTTKLPDNAHNPKRPVIVHVHSGGFYSGSGRQGPQYFLDQDIVLVTFNYRLGTLGFLSVGKEAPGNYGLKDQVVVMKWVKKNIAFFGGDPDSVTLFGYSAGSRSVSLHMVSPMSRGLFHKAILGSGSALGAWPINNNQIEVAKRQARLLNCSDNTPKEIVNCLKMKPAEDFSKTLLQFVEWGYYLTVTWAPVIEEDIGQQRFLLEHPIKTIENGNFTKVPVLAGITKNEFEYSAIILVNNKTLLNDLDANFEEIAPIIFLYERGTTKSKEISRNIRKFYLGGGQPLNNASFSGLSHIYNDAVTGFPINRAVDLLSEKSSKPVYYYQFSYQGRYSFYYYPNSNNQTYGVVHHDDLIYLFYISPRFQFFNETYPESKMVETMTTLWANFAKTGKPSLNARQDDVKWETYNAKTKRYMDIGNKLVLKNNLHDERYSLWRKLLPISYYLQKN